MASRNSSKTALGVAALRAVHQLLDGEPKILEDPIAARLVGPDIIAGIQAHPERAADPGIAALRGHVVLRSRYAEDRLAQAVARGVRQCVVLGAGLDTFAYRQPDWARSLRIYEVDHPASQEDKRRRLAVAGIPLPENLEFVAIDFEHVSLRDGLLSSSLDVSAPTFFSCLGVLIYLSREAVDAVFALVASFPASSEIVFTFSTPESADSPLGARAAALGEPWLTHFVPDSLVDQLRALGFSTISLLRFDDLAPPYLAGRTDGLAISGRGGIVAAINGEV